MEIEGSHLKKLVESLLFVADKPTSLRRLSQALEVPPAALERALAVLDEECRGRGVQLVRQGESVQMVTCPEAAAYVERFLEMEGGGKLSTAALETLAIVAYEQPVTRARIEAIRGVACDGVLATLVSRGLIEVVGRQETVGRPFLYSTTMKFLHHFGLPNLAALPPLEKPLAAAKEQGEKSTASGPSFTFA